MHNPWIVWPGGKMPVPKGTLVDVEYRDGGIAARIEAGVAMAVSRRWAIEWGHHGYPSDIIAYRISTPNAEKIADAMLKDKMLPGPLAGPLGPFPAPAPAQPVRATTAQELALFDGLIKLAAEKWGLREESMEQAAKAARKVIEARRAL